MIEFCIIPVSLWPNFAINFTTVNENTIKSFREVFKEKLAFEKSLILKCLLFGFAFIYENLCIFRWNDSSSFCSFFFVTEKQ